MEITIFMDRMSMADGHVFHGKCCRLSEDHSYLSIGSSVAKMRNSESLSLTVRNFRIFTGIIVPIMKLLCNMRVDWAMHLKSIVASM